MGWGVTGECWHGHKTQVVKDNMPDSQGRIWISEYPKDCRLCEPNKRLRYYTEDQPKETK